MELTKGSFLTFVEMSVKRQVLGIWSLFALYKKKKKEEEEKKEVREGLRDKIRRRISAVTQGTEGLCRLELQKVKGEGS